MNQSDQIIDFGVY